METFELDQVIYNNYIFKKAMYNFKEKLTK